MADLRHSSAECVRMRKMRCVWLLLWRNIRWSLRCITLDYLHIRNSSWRSGNWRVDRAESFPYEYEAEHRSRVKSARMCGIHATSLGTTESLIQQQASSPTHGPGTKVPEDLLRLSIGLEHSDDLVEDLIAALESAHRAVGEAA